MLKERRGLGALTSSHLLAEGPQVSCFSFLSLFPFCLILIQILIPRSIHLNKTKRNKKPSPLQSVGDSYQLATERKPFSSSAFSVWENDKLLLTGSNVRHRTEQLGLAEQTSNAYEGSSSMDPKSQTLPLREGRADHRVCATGQAEGPLPQQRKAPEGVLRGVIS